MYSTEARLLAAAAAGVGYSPAYPHHAQAHHPHPALHHPHSGGGGGNRAMTMTQKDIDELRQATRAIKSLREQSGKLKRKNPPQPVVSSSNEKHSPAKRSKSKSSDETLTTTTATVEKDIMVECPKRRGGNNSNNFSIENLIAKDRSVDSIISSSKVVVEGPSSPRLSIVSENSAGSLSDSDLEDHHHDGNGSIRVEEDDIDLSEDEGSKDNDSETKPRSPPSPAGSTQSLRSSSAPSPKFLSRNNGNSAVTGGGNGGGLLPSAYPFYAAAFLSAQSLLYSHPAYFQSAAGALTNGSGAPHHQIHHHQMHHSTFGSHNNPNNAILFNAKDLSGI
jgi:hypothetical protein